MSAPAATPEPEQEQAEQAQEVAVEPLTASNELAAIAEKAGASESPVLGLGLALLAVAGGGAAWKFYQKFSEQKHEQAMKKMELDAANAGMNGAQPPPCQAANMKIEAEIADIKMQVAQTTQAIQSAQAAQPDQTLAKSPAFLNVSNTVEEHEDRLKKIEKSLKKK
jgi:uncharacterized protein HemX